MPERMENPMVIREQETGKTMPWKKRTMMMMVIWEPEPAKARPWRIMVMTNEAREISIMAEAGIRFPWMIIRCLERIPCPLF